MKHYQVCLDVQWVDPANGEAHRWRCLFDDIGAYDEPSATAIAASMFHAPGAIVAAEAIVLPSRSCKEANDRAS